MNRTNRVGKISITEHMYEKETYTRTAEGLGHIKFLPLHVEHHHHKGQIELTGLSPRFDIVKEGEMIPLYLLTFVNCPDGSLGSVSADRVEG